MNYAGLLPSNVVRGGGFFARPRQTSSDSCGTYRASVSDFVDSFYAELRRWQSETAFCSDPDQITSHPSFFAMVENASVTLPFIIKELKAEPSLLVWVLDDAFDEKPYDAATVGNIPKMTNAWILWAERNGQSI